MVRQGETKANIYKVTSVNANDNVIKRAGLEGHSARVIARNTVPNGEFILDRDNLQFYTWQDNNPTRLSHAWSLPLPHVRFSPKFESVYIFKINNKEVIAAVTLVPTSVNFYENVSPGKYKPAGKTENRFNAKQLVRFGTFLPGETPGMITILRKDVASYRFERAPDGYKMVLNKIWKFEEELVVKGVRDIFVGKLEKAKTSIAFVKKGEVVIADVQDDHLVTKCTVRPDLGTIMSIHFASLTKNQANNELILIGKLGLKVYQLQPDKKLKMLNYNPLFSDLKGFPLKNAHWIFIRDIHNDGDDELIFTGPSGVQILSYIPDQNLWQSVLDSEILTPSQRNSDILTITSTQPPIILSRDVNGRIFSWGLAAVPPPKVIEEPAEKSNTVSRPINLEKSVETIPRAILPLRDLLDYDAFMKCVDTVTGKPKFSIAFLDIISRHFGFFQLSYDASSKESDIVGLGWTIPHFFILLDDQGSIFPEEHKYFLLANGVSKQLFLLKTDSSDNHHVHTYTTQSPTDSEEDNNKKQPFIEIKHTWDETNDAEELITDFWTIKTDTVIQTFGNAQPVPRTEATAVAFDVKWENWRGSGSNYYGLVWVAKMWYLSEMASATGETLATLQYRNDQEDVECLLFTREIYLESLTDVKSKAKVTFTYDTKVEISIPDHTMQQKGAQKEPHEETQLYPDYDTAMLQTHYLSGYLLETPDFKQQISFNYELLANTRFLTQIQQNGDVVLQFGYDRLTNQLSSISSPENFDINFHYETYESQPPKPVEIAVAYGEKPLVTHGRGYVVVSHASIRNITMQIFPANMEIDERNQPTGFCLKCNTEEYNVIPSVNIITFHAKNFDFANLCIFHRHKSDGLLQWNTRPQCSRHRRSASIRYGEDFVLVADAEKLMKYSYQNGQIETLELGNNDPTFNLLIAANRKMFAVLNNTDLTLHYKDAVTGTWTSKTTPDIDNPYSVTKGSFNQFYLRGEMFANILNSVREASLHLMGSFVTVLEIRLTAALSSVISIYNINTDHEVDDRSYVPENVTAEVDIETFSREFPSTDPESYGKPVKYKYDRGLSGKYELFAFEENKNPNPVNNTFLFDLREFLVHVTPTLIACNGSFAKYDGNAWTEITIPKDQPVKKIKNTVPISDFIQLEQDTNDSPATLVKFGRNEVRPLELLVNSLDGVFNGHPYYLAYHEREGEPLQIIRFTNDGEDWTYPKPLESIDEVLHPASTPQMLITQKVDERKKVVGLVFRSMIPNARTDTVLRQTLHLNNKVRPIGYKFYHDSAVISGDTINFKKVAMRPGDDVTKFGEVVQTHNESGVDKEVRDSEGEIIKIEKSTKPKPDREVDDNEVAYYYDITLMDKENSIEIAEFYPFQMSRDEVAYYGFEDYEKNQPGTSGSWKYTGEIKSEDSFTGSKYLQLTNGRLEREFTPKDQEIVYKTSIWARTSEALNVNDISPVLKANVFAGKRYGFSILSNVSTKVGDWYMLEVIIDLPRLRKTEINGRVPADEEALVIKISVTASKNRIDIDHILFAPVASSAEISVYDASIWKVTETIKASGLVIRHVHDRYHTEIGIVNEYNQLPEFNSYTKLSTAKFFKFDHRCQIKIQSKNGLMENFHNGDFSNRWNIGNPRSWGTIRNGLVFSGTASDELTLRRDSFNTNSICVRFYYQLLYPESSLHLLDEITIAASEYPTTGEIILISENFHIFLFIDGVLRLDNYQLKSPAPNDGLKFRVSNKVALTDVIVMEYPAVSLTYVNALNEILQSISLEDTNVALSQTYENDVLGRRIKESLPIRRLTKSGEPLFNYRPFNDDVSHKRYHYHKHPIENLEMVEITGTDFAANKFPQKYSDKIAPHHAYLRRVYKQENGYWYKVEHKSGIEEISVFKGDLRVALYVVSPGTIGLLSTYDYNENNQLILTLPPMYHSIAMTLLAKCPPDEALKKKLGFALTYSDGKQATLTLPDAGKTENVYNSNGVLKYILSFAYENDAKVTSAIYFNFDEYNRVSSSGIIENVRNYDTLIGMKDLDINPNQHKHLGVNIRTYQWFEYNDVEKDPFLRQRVKRVLTLQNEEPYFAEEFLSNLYNNLVSKRIYVPTSKETEVIEINKEYTADLLKEIEYPFEIGGKNLKIQYEYNRLGQMTKIIDQTVERPLGEYTYNEMGAITTEILVPKNMNTFSRTFEYNELGFIKKLSDKYLQETLTYTEAGYGEHGNGGGAATKTMFEARWHQFADQRRFQLTAANFMSIDENLMPQSQAEKCLKALQNEGYIKENHQEKIFYEQDVTKFPNDCTGSKSGKHLAHMLGTHGFPKVYGHAYDYGNSHELTKAKYFVGEDKPLQPLQPDTFHLEYPNQYSTQQSQELWNILMQTIGSDRRYITSDNANLNIASAQGKRRESFITPLTKSLQGLPPVDVSSQTDKIIEIFKRNPTADAFKNQFNREVVNDASTSVKVWEVLQNKQYKDERKYENLADDLMKLNEGNNAAWFEKDIEKLLVSHFVDDKPLSEETLSQHLQIWHGENKSALAKGIYRKLSDLQIISNNRVTESLLATEFVTLLARYSPQQRKQVVKILTKYFSQQLGTAEFDVESYQVDENGNHRRYTTGFALYTLNYTPKTNRIDNVSIEFKHLKNYNRDPHEMKYDDRGNVVVAKHKGIEQIVYNKVVNKPSKFVKTNGEHVELMYDAKADRILKRVNKRGTTTKEIHYIRDENGRCLVEREIIFLPKLPPIVTITAYVYGPKGLVGFYRRDKYYNVITDHEGSVRLIEQGGEIVAAYDYLPYGGLMRSYVKEPDADISYRYTGQEWDAEVGLYYYQARQYDPDIGRFLQMDPKGQYFSPYKYAGNSPISMVDPNGELAFLLILAVVVLVGAYLGGAAATGLYNPLKWDWTDLNTWKGIAMGAAIGASLPYGAVASAAYLTGVLGSSIAAWVIVAAVGVGFAYGQTARLTKSWNPLKWDFSDPKVAFSLFEGFATGVTAINNVQGVVNFFKGLSKAKKLIFIFETLFDIGVVILDKAAEANWNWSELAKPETLIAILESILKAPAGVQGKFSKISKKWDKIEKAFEMSAGGKGGRGKAYRMLTWFVIKRIGPKALKYGAELLVGPIIQGVVGFALDYHQRKQNWVTPGSAYKGYLDGVLAGMQQKLPSVSVLQADPNRLVSIDGQNKPSYVPPKYTHLSRQQNPASAVAIADIVHAAFDRVMEDSVINLHIDQASMDNAALNAKVVSQVEAKKTILLDNTKAKLMAAMENQGVRGFRFVDFESSGSGFLKGVKKHIRQFVSQQLGDPIAVEKRTDRMMEAIGMEVATSLVALGVWQVAKYSLAEDLRVLDEPKRIPAMRKFIQFDYAQNDILYTSSGTAKTTKPFTIGECTQCTTSPIEVSRNLTDGGWMEKLSYANGPRLFVPINDPLNTRTMKRRSIDPMRLMNEILFGITTAYNEEHNSTTEQSEGGIDEEEENEESKIIDLSDLPQSQNTTSWLRSKISSCLRYLNITAKEVQPSLTYQSHMDANLQAYPTLSAGGGDPQNSPSFTPDYSTLELHSTVFLMDLCVRKITGEKYISNANDPMYLEKSQVQAMNIVDELEMVLDDIVDGSLNEMIDYPRLQCKIFETIAKGNVSKIGSVIAEALETDLGSLDNIHKKKIIAYLRKTCQ